MGVNRKNALKQLKLLDKRAKNMRLAAEGWDSQWKTLIAISLSAQSRDEMTIKIASALFAKYPSLNSLAKAKYADVLSVLKSMNYNRSKAKHVIACAKKLAGEHKGVVPLDFDKLILLPGVGRKTANVFLSEMGFDAVGIDTHSAYISQKLGWTKQKHPHKIEGDLRNLFPKTHWKKINPVLVRFGKTHTSKRKKDSILKLIKGGK